MLTAIVLVIGIGGAKIAWGSFELKGTALATVVAIVLSLFFRLSELLGLSNDKGLTTIPGRLTPDAEAG